MPISKAKSAVKWVACILAPLLAAATTGQARCISFGLSIGVPLNDLSTSGSGTAATAGRYSFGPILEVSLPRGFSLGANLLYKQLGFGLASSVARLRAHRVELPLLLRYDYRSTPIRSFAHAGMSFNKILSIGGSGDCEEAIAGRGFYCIDGKPVVQLRHKNTYGFVLGAGVTIGVRAVRLEPELRITRWADRNFGTQDSPLRSNLTQIELLLGFRF